MNTLAPPTPPCYNPPKPSEVTAVNVDNNNLIVEDTGESYSLQEVRNRVILGDTLEILPRLPAECADAVFIDPPYFLQLPAKELKRWNVKTEVKGVDEEWDRFASFEEYDAFVRRLLTGAKRVMKPTATIWVIATYHSIYRIGAIMQDMGFWLLNDVIWLKSNPMPNWLGVRFTNATETLIWSVKSKSVKGYTFNKDFVKDISVGKVGANVWVIPLCAGGERLKNEEGEKLHSTQKPIELLRRVILSSTNEGDLILDPVAGTGTTGYVAKALNRDFIMIEANRDYAEGIQTRFGTPLELSRSGELSEKERQKVEKYLKIE